MLVSIGRREENQDVVELFLECHTKIRRFVGGAKALAADLNEPRAEDVRAVRRYFAEALPLHAADEDESLVPRLRGRDPEVDRALTLMGQEHVEHAPWVRELVTRLLDVEAEPSRIALHRSRLAELASALEAHFEQHLGLEERVIFPRARELLSAAQQHEVLFELRARRGASTFR
jgi:hemerythrin-like domain-containing protein